MLRADEVALVLRGSQTRGVTERVRNKMKDGSYGAGARQVDGVWQLPLSDLAEVIDPTPTAPPLPIPGRLPGEGDEPRKRRRSTIGPYLRFIRQARFWADVFRAMGMIEDSDALKAEADAVLADLRTKAQVARAERSRQDLLDNLDLDKPRKSTRPPIF